jgi:outer membrane protein assembly factor BamA
LFRKVEATGLPIAFHSEAIAADRSKRPFSSAALERIRSDLVHELGRRGYLFAAVEASYALQDGGTHADCVLKVTCGPQVRVRKILPVGNKRTVDELILSQAMMTEGLPLDVDTLYSTQANLTALGIFRLVEVEVLAPEVPEPLKTVLLKVHEQPRIAEVGPGYFSADGLNGFIDLGWPNLGGRGINLSSHIQLNAFLTSVPVLTRQVDLSTLAWYKQFGGRGNISVQNRGLLPFQIGMRIDLVGERVFRPQFIFTRFALVPSLDWSKPFEIKGLDFVHPKVTLLLQNEIEYAGVQRTSSSFTVDSATTFLDQERLRFLFGDFGLETIRFAPTLDLRDSALNPHVGLIVQGSAEVTTAIATADEQGKPVPVSFMKAQGLATVYVPMGKTVLAVSARGGRIVPLVPNSTTPPVKRFFLGGSTSMRGFNEDQLVAEDQRGQYHGEVRDCQILAAKDGCSSAAKTIAAGRQVPSQGGEFFALFKAELRFPAFSVFDLGVFVEAGNLYLALPTGPLAFRYIVGAGIRYVTPIGPLALDVGVNPGYDSLINEPPVVVHFNIGVF